MERKWHSLGILAWKSVNRGPGGLQSIGSELDTTEHAQVHKSQKSIVSL